MTEPGDELALRAGDRDRDRAARELYLHHLDGRLDSDELEERLSRAYAARTFGDLAAVLGDLPVLDRAEADRPDPEAGEPPRVRGFGVIPFAQVHRLPVAADQAYAEALDSLVRAMRQFGYALVERDDPRSLTFQSSERPLWVPIVCVVAFPFGLFALAFKRTSRVRIDVVGLAAGRCQMTVSGEARRAVRKAFARLVA